MKACPQTLAPHLPYFAQICQSLNRGLQSSGDTHVRAAPDRPFLAGDQSLMEGVPPRVGLYRLFHAIWQSAAEHYDEPAILATGGPVPRARKADSGNPCRRPSVPPCS